MSRIARRFGELRAAWFEQPEAVRNEIVAALKAAVDGLAVADRLPPEFRKLFLDTALSAASDAVIGGNKSKVILGLAEGFPEAYALAREPLERMLREG